MRAAGFAIRTPRTHARFAGLATVAACVGVGCQSTTPAEPSVSSDPPAPTEMNWQETPITGARAAMGKPVPVQTGAPPLAYLSDMSAMIRVVDESSSETLAESTVGPRTIVRVDQRTGVVMGRVTLIPGPLPPGHAYTIYVLPQEENVSRTGRSMPRPAKPDESVGDIETKPTAGAETHKSPPGRTD